MTRPSSEEDEGEARPVGTQSPRVASHAGASSPPDGYCLMCPLISAPELFILSYAHALMQPLAPPLQPSPSLSNDTSSQPTAPPPASDTHPHFFSSPNTPPVLGAASSSPGLPTLSSTTGLGSGGSGDRSSPHWRALFQPKSVRIALRVPLFSFGDFVMMELLRPLSPLTTLLVETGVWPSHATPLCISHDTVETLV